MASRRASTRGPNPASSNSPEPFTSIKLALPALPLASTVNLRDIRIPLR
jgi:hypothetical protein